MIRLVYSDRAPHLADALATQIRRAQQAHGPLDPVPVVVPDQAAAAYLKMAVAARAGIAANLQLEFLRTYLERLVPAADGRAIVDPARLELLMVDALGREGVLEDPDLAPVARYLAAAGADRSARDLRRTQLSRLLAQLFDAYLLTRPELLKAWLEDPRPSEHPVERWERALWRALQPGMRDAGLVPLGDMLDVLDTRDAAWPSTLHVWGVSVGGSVLQQVLAHVARHTELWLYTLNPCLEFWEDVQTGQSAEALRGRLAPRDEASHLASPFGEDPFGLQGPEADTPALRLWGRPGRENIRLLNQLTDCDFEACFSDIDRAPRTVLEHLQRDVLLREPERRTPCLGPEGADDSLALTACASLRREVEHIAKQIWRLVDAPPGHGPPLRFDEIAVALVGSDQDAYRAHIGSVFKEHHDIPRTALDVPLSGSSRVVEAFELLLTLPNSEFRRQDLLRLITHPAVISRFADATADEWLGWCEELMVVHGADHEDHEDTYITRDLYNWDQGMRRLVLGTFMSGAASGDERRFDIQGQRYLPQEYPMDRLTGAAQLVVLVRSLIADARFAKSARFTVSTWAQYLRTLVSTYVTPDSEQDERDLLRVLATLQRLEALHPTGDEVSFEVAAQLVRARLEALTTNHGQPLADGVVVAPLSLIAALPFRVVFVPGLSEGRFPSGDRRTQLDLRARHRRAGDVSPRERDQYWFLERLVSTTDSLRLSWVSRSAQTGDQLEASPVVQELRGILERGYLGPEGVERIASAQPLRRYSEPEGRFEAQAAHRERQVLALRDDLVRHLGEGAELPELVDLRAGLPADTWGALARRLRLAEPPPAAPAAGSRIDVPYRALRRFLEDPLQGWAEQVLQLRTDDIEADPYATEDERFRTERLDEQRLLEDVFLDHLDATETPLEARYAQHAELLELSGAMPTGVFAESERRRHLETLEAWRVQLRRAMQGRLQPVRRHRFGRAREHARLREITDPIRVPLTEERAAWLFGSTEPLSEADPASYVFLARPPLRGRARVVPELRCFLDHAVLAASGRRFERGYRGFIAYGRPDPESLDSVRFEAFSPSEARGWLADCLGELLDRPHAYILPFATAVGVFEARDRGKSAIEEVLAQARPSPFGPLARADVRPPSVDEAVRIVETRLGPYFSRRIVEGAR